MRLLNKNRQNDGGILGVIRCDEPSYLIWKWHPAGTQLGDSKREYAIRWGSSLRVKDGEVAVFVYKQKNGTMQDYIEGPFDQIIKTANFPVLSNIIGAAYDGGTPFQAEIYFINLARIVQVKFGVPFFDVYDPRFSDFGVPVAVRGTVSFEIKDYREFIKLHRLTSFNVDDFQVQIRDAICRYVKDAVANAPAENNIPLVQIESKTAQINDVIEYDLGERLKENFGVNVSGIDIGAIEIDKSSEGYRQLLSVTKDVTAATVKAETEAKVKDIAMKQRIEAENYEDLLRRQREEGQYAQHMQTRTSNIDAFQVEKQAEVGVAGANALGQMGANGAGNVDFGGGSGGMGFNPAAIMAEMAVGGAIGQNIAGTMNNMMSGMNQSVQVGTVPPPIPTSAYNVAVNGQATGPFDIYTLQQMAQQGQFGKNSLVWKAGMSQWVKAETVDELNAMFGNIMPPIPTDSE
jgi:membrane protease subunit (stomatin/prohibitin family)